MPQSLNWKICLVIGSGQFRLYTGYFLGSSLKSPRKFPCTEFLPDPKKPSSLPVSSFRTHPSIFQTWSLMFPFFPASFKLWNIFSCPFTGLSMFIYSLGPSLLLWLSVSAYCSILRLYFTAYIHLWESTYHVSLSGSELPHSVFSFTQLPSYFMLSLFLRAE